MNKKDVQDLVVFEYLQTLPKFGSHLSDEKLTLLRKKLDLISLIWGEFFLEPIQEENVFTGIKIIYLPKAPISKIDPIILNEENFTLANLTNSLDQMIAQYINQCDDWAKEVIRDPNILVETMGIDQYEAQTIANQLEEKMEAALKDTSWMEEAYKG